MIMDHGPWDSLAISHFLLSSTKVSEIPAYPRFEVGAIPFYTCTGPCKSLIEARSAPNEGKPHGPGEIAVKGGKSIEFRKSNVASVFGT